MSNTSFKRKIVSCFVTGILAMSVPIARADDKPIEPVKPDAAKTDAPKTDAAGMDAAMMEAFMKAATPGPEHARLKEFVGVWNAETKSWTPDGKDCGNGKGTMTNKMVLGDRFLVMEFDGEMTSPMGSMPYHGMGIAGYDNAAKKYFNIWMDDMSTGMMKSQGSVDGKVQTSEGSFTDPMSGKQLKTKEILTIVDKDHQKFELHMQATPDAPLTKCMEISYTRK